VTSLTLDKLSVRYGAHQALREVDLHLDAGECVLLAGASGSGKSTLVRCLGRLIPQCLPGKVSGSVLVDGRSVEGVPVAELSRSIGMVFQNPRTQLLNVRVEDEVAFGPRNLGLDDPEVERRVARSLDATGLTHLRPRTTRTLSGGELQRLAVAAVLAMGPRVLVLDEPMANLDADGTRALVETVRKLNREDGVTCILVEHRLGPAAEVAGRTVLLDHGEVAADGPTDDVLDDGAILDRLGLQRPTDGTQVPWRELIEPGPARTGEPVVALRGVTAGEGSPPALSGVDLTIRRGDFVALVGHNGAGKSTLARVIAGLLKPRKGVVSYGGRRRLRPGSGVGMVFQDPTAQLLCDTVEQEVTLGPRNLGRRDPGPVDAALAATDLDAYRGRAVYGLSLGEQQRLTVAAVLSMRPDFVILDEPTVGQDRAHMDRFMSAMRRLNETGSTILLITHDSTLVERCAKRVVVLDGGRVVADGAPRRQLGDEGEPACVSA
jgi:energy-coupling factor transport system ATP-binding protein